MAEYKIYFDFKNDFAEQKSLTWRITSNPDDADVFVIEGLRLKDDEKAVLKHKPYLPVIYVGKNCRFKEFSIDEYFAPDLKQELHKIECVLKRIHELNDASIKDSMENLIFAVMVFAWSRDRFIKPILTSKKDKGYYYPIEAAGHQRITAAVEEVEHLGYFDKEVFDAAHVCPKCQSIEIILRDGCPKCESVDIEDAPLLHHFPCSYQGPEDNFLMESGVYQCPKCKKVLNQIGLDYDKPGTIVVCHACQEEFDESEVLGRCLACEARFKIEESERRNIYQYHLNDQGVEVLLTSELSYNPGKMFASSLELISEEAFDLYTAKLASMFDREQLSSYLIVADMGTATEFAKLSIYEKIRVINTLANEIAKSIRQTDAVTYAQSQLKILVVDVGEKDINLMGERIKKVVKKAVQNKYFQGLEVLRIPVNEISHGGGNDH